MNLFGSDAHLNEDERSLVAVQEIKPKRGSKGRTLKDLEVLACHVDRSSKETACFWVLEYLEEYSDDKVVIFSRFDTDAAYQKHVDCLDMKQTRLIVILLLRRDVDVIQRNSQREHGLGEDD